MLKAAVVFEITVSIQVPVSAVETRLADTGGVQTGLKSIADLSKPFCRNRFIAAPLGIVLWAAADAQLRRVDRITRRSQ